MYARRMENINCFQINLQHSTTATSNLWQLINQHNVDITCVQEPYTINNKLAGLPKFHRVYTFGDGRKRTAIVINNDLLDATVITKLSNGKCVAVKVRSEAVNFYSVSMYFDSRRDIEEDIRQLEKVMDYTKGNGLLIAVDRNASRSSFGGLEVACWPLVPKFAGRIFQDEKPLSTPSFGGEVKPSAPCRRFMACKRLLNATWKSGISGKTHRPFLAHIVTPLATRISGETTSGESWNV